MAIVNSANLSGGQVLSLVQAALVRHRAALKDINDLYAWTSGITPADLEGLGGGLSEADAGAILSAVADAHAEYLIHTTGQPPGSYPQAGSAYIYANSQTAVIGPLRDQA
jgi:hypothetical protein